MPAFQKITAFVNVGGNRDQVVYKGEEEALTLPEVMVLRAIHGGVEHVHGLVVVGEEEMDPDIERERLGLKYGSNLVGSIFPMGVPLPVADQSLPSREEVEASAAAAREAAEKVRAKKVRAKKAGKAEDKAPAKTAEKAPTVPDIDALPSK
jgi:hypothetical protein